MNTRLTPSLIIVLLLAFLLGIACSEDSTPLTPDPGPSPRDTTSHDFVWEFDTIAVQFSSITSVAAISPTDIWVTGKFFQHDSLGRPDAKSIGNVAHWDGKEWTYHGFNSAGRESWYEMADAFATNADNVWVCGGGPFRWDGARWITYRYEGFYFGSGIIETWVTKNAKYACVVGLDRSCAYYRKDDPFFKKVFIPYQEDCLDVTGTEDGTMYVAAGSQDPYNGHIYKINPDRTAEVYWVAKEMDPFSIWMQNGLVYFTSAEAIWRVKEEGNRRFAEFVYEANLHILEEDHDEENNIFLMLQRGYFLHWNGSTWKEFLIPYPGEFWAHDIDVNGRDVYFVGFGTGQYCVIAHGRQM